LVVKRTRLPWMRGVADEPAGGEDAVEEEAW